MSAPDDDPPTGSSRRNDSTTCQPLLDLATPDMYRANAFRITGLSIDATAREIARHAEKLKMMEELGQGASLHTGAFALRNPPTVDQIRDAIQRIKDPEQRIIDEFFWFWPRQFGQGATDPAFKAIAAGDADAALKIWTELETSPTDGVTAMHNIAVLWHFMALEWENHYAKSEEFTEEKRAETEKLWRGAFKRWELLAVDDAFWEIVTARIKQLDDPRLTAGFVRKMRATLPDALDKVNAELAVRYAEGGRLAMAWVHVKFMRETNQGLDNVDKTAELVLTPAIKRLKQQIERAQELGKTSAAGAQAVRELIEHARQAHPLFEVFHGPNGTATIELFSEVAQAGNILLVAYGKETDDNEACVSLGSELLVFAGAPDLKHRIETNIGIWQKIVDSKPLRPIYALINAVGEGRHLPSFRFDRFRKTVVPALATPPVPVGSKLRIELFDAVAGVLRGISLEAWNKHQDKVTAAGANAMALHYVQSEEYKKLLLEDTEAYNKIFNARGDKAGEAAQMERGHYDAMLYVVLGFILQIIWSGFAFHWLLQNALHLNLKVKVEIDMLIGAAGGAPFALLVFWDRWRCIERVASRVCSGMVNLSILYVPIVAMVYANWRGILKVVYANEDQPWRRWTLAVLWLAMIIGGGGMLSDIGAPRRRPVASVSTPAARRPIYKTTPVAPASYVTSPSAATAPEPGALARAEEELNASRLAVLRSMGADANKASNSGSTSNPKLTGEVMRYDPLAGRMYRVPSWLAPELQKERDSIQAEQMALEISEQDLDRLASEIDTRRPSLNAASKASVADFNRKVDSYNEKLKEARAKQTRINQRIQKYNSNLQQYGR